MEKQTGRKPAELEGPEFPYEMSSLWAAFLALNSGRTAGFNGPQGLSFTEIKAWSELTDTPLSPLDVETIKKLDQVYLKVANG